MDAFIRPDSKVRNHIYIYISGSLNPRVCSITKFLGECSTSGVNSSKHSNKTVDKERLAWQAKTSYVVAEHSKIYQVTVHIPGKGNAI